MGKAVNTCLASGRYAVWCAAVVRYGQPEAGPDDPAGPSSMMDPAFPIINNIPIHGPEPASHILTMAGSTDDAAWTMEKLSIPSYQIFVRYICFACAGIGLLFILPFLFLIVLDIVLWILRTCFNSKRHRPKEYQSDERLPDGAITTAVDDSKRHHRSNMH
ncbi:uncharacterized protein J7T54_005251 [Emericellopsis cladophorae]|uniref:Uncharacterized protein n=1 Tax=Emericellopsis cladophorae TaxID=2686198 RepID=A0A9Q0BBL3_9HYPO|nr:uncharacterized protein J7T54_005251 [Emericellopsis cladophorae]KAI6779437.1 hypothetical protein J7T54_005251 [Emericellopsis cladophorae]